MARLPCLLVASEPERGKMKKGLTKMTDWKKKGLAVLSAVGMAGLSMANTDTSSATTLETALDSVKTTFEGYVTTAFPILAAVVVAGLGIWVLPKIVRWIKRGFN